MAKDTWAVEYQIKDHGSGWGSSVKYYSSRRSARADQANLAGSLRAKGVVILQNGVGDYYGAMFSDTASEPKQHTLFIISVYEKPERSYP